MSPFNCTISYKYLTEVSFQGDRPLTNRFTNRYNPWIILTTKDWVLQNQSVFRNVAKIDI